MCKLKILKNNFYLYVKENQCNVRGEVTIKIENVIKRVTDFFYKY